MNRSFRWSWGGLLLAFWCLLCWCLRGGQLHPDATLGGASVAQGQGIAVPNAGLAGDLDEETGIFLPSDRLRERQLDQARQAIAAGGFSDASTVIDDILAGDADSFLRSEDGGATWSSVKAEAGALLDAMPAAGRDAYELQFRARAERMLAEALAADDREQVVAVARRWFHTPSGQAAAVMTAFDCLANGQPLSALAWLDRLAGLGDVAAFEPSLSLMRAVAAYEAGDREAAEAALAEAMRRGNAASLQLGNASVAQAAAAGSSLGVLDRFYADAAGDGWQPSAASGAWLMAGGSPSRAVSIEASRPLLAARFRVPLTRHPGESRLLERQRILARDRQQPLLPAGQPLVVGDTIVVRSPLGLLGVDFTTGKRIWLQPGRFEDDTGLVGMAEQADVDSGQQSVARGFEDLTTGTLSSDGRLVFAVESPSASAASFEQQRIVRPFGGSSREFSGNVLSAYVASDKGRLAWRLPSEPADSDADANSRQTPGIGGFPPEAGSPWYLGPPLPVGSELFVLVEELGEIRVDVLDAASGSVQWSQPLAELDEARRIEQPGSRSRRLAGLSPSLDDGVLVCPTGAGGVVGIDVATRTLLWAYRYQAKEQANVVRLPNGMIIRRNVRGVTEVAQGDQSVVPDATPVMADGRVFLLPAESDELHCLETRTGKLIWKTPRRDGLILAGIEGEQLVLVGSETVAAHRVADGSLAWPERFSLKTVRTGTMPSGRGVLSEGRLLLPVDAPAVLDISLQDGSLTAISSGRDAIPGNLVAYRGEILSQSIDSLDVFYQAGPLEQMLQAESDAPPDGERGLRGGLVGYWMGQLLIDAGQPRQGADLVVAAAAEDPGRVTPGMVAVAMLQAMRQDFAATAALFPAALEACPDKAIAAELLRVGIDGFLAMQQPQQAWRVWQQAAVRCLAGETVALGDDAEAGPVADGSDLLLASTPPRWLGGRLEAILRQVDTAEDGFAEELSGAVQAFVDTQARQAQAEGYRQMETLADLVAAHPSATTVREQLVEMLANPAPGQEAVSIGAQKDRLLQLELTRLLLTDREPASGDRPIDDPAWPVGRVAVKSYAQQGRRAQSPPLASLPVVGHPGIPFPDGLRLTLDRRQPGMLLHDGFGRQLGGPLSYDGSSQTRRFGIQAVMIPGAAVQPTMVGRLLLVTSANGTAAFELDLPESDDADVATLQHRRLWISSDGQATSTLTPQVMGNAADGWLPLLRGSIPLGTAISEPRGVGRDAAPKLRSISLVPNGAAVLQGRTLSLREPVTGRVLWSRSMLPAAAEVLLDTECVCVCAAGGGEATVYSMQDGRRVGACQLPPVTDWLSSCGRLVLSVSRMRGNGFGAGSVELLLHDPLSEDTVRFGPFSAESRAVAAGPGKVALLDPEGHLTVIDLLTGTADFEATLEGMPPGFDQLALMPWRDRLLVVASRPETSEESQRHLQLGAITGVRTAGLWDAGQQLAPLVTGAVWAVDRQDGEALWSVPATLLRHGFDAEQPADLPVLVFARRIKPAGSSRQPQLSLLCLDKRTGNEVFLDDRIETDQHLFYGCEIVASPGDHAVTLTHGGRDITLTFTGETLSPRPPYQGLTRLPSPPSLSDKIEQWFEQALEALPLP